MYNHNKAKTVCIFLGIYCTPTSSKAKHIIVWWLVSNFRSIWCLIYGENVIFEIHYFLIWIRPHENCLTPKTGSTKCYKWMHCFRWGPWIYLNKQYAGRSQQKRIHKFGTVCCIHVYIKDSKYVCSAFHFFLKSDHLYHPVLFDDMLTLFTGYQCSELTFQHC